MFPPADWTEQWLVKNFFQVWNKQRNIATAAPLQPEVKQIQKHSKEETKQETYAQSKDFPKNELWTTMEILKR